MGNNYNYDIFISYSVNDETLAKEIWSELNKYGIRVFWSNKSLQDETGESWFDIIQKSLENSQHMILICTEDSMKSKWVKREYSAFYNHFYKSGVRKLIPILPDAYNASQLPIFIRDLQIIKYNSPNSLATIVKMLTSSKINANNTVTKYPTRKYISKTNIYTIFSLILIIPVIYIYLSFFTLKKNENDKKIISIFFTLHNKYCDTYHEHEKDLKNALEKDPNMMESKDHIGTFETNISNISFAITPEDKGCTTDFKIKNNSNDIPYFGFQDINSKINESGYKKFGTKKVKIEKGLNNKDVKVVEQNYKHRKNNTLLRLEFPLENEDQYYMTMFVKKFKVKEIKLYEVKNTNKSKGRQHSEIADANPI